MINYLDHYRDRIKTVGLTEYELEHVIIYNEGYHLGRLTCKKCGRIAEVNLKEWLPNRVHCICVSANECKYCGKLFAPKNRNSKQRKVCYECNPYDYKSNTSLYKKTMRKLDEKLKNK